MAKKKPFENSDAAYAKGVNSGDAASVAALYAKDAVFMAPGMPAYKGTKGVKAQTQAMIDAGWRNFKLKSIKSGSDGDLAFNIGKVTMDQPAGRRMTRVAGKYLDIYARQADGSWKIVATSYSPDTPAT
ncbi:MAG: SgcJ/EcaC family oxidoreductase [Dongiaceae bacterium]